MGSVNVQVSTRDPPNTIRLTHIDIFALRITDQEFHNEMLGPRRDGLLADVFDDLADLHLRSLLSLRLIVSVTCWSCEHEKAP
jgi:hypothetical protein